jgi:4-amino-4-deoxy-L-arabinose transferase-like glycosyltransferase
VQSKWLKILLFIGMALLLWLPRGIDLDHFVTADEPKWLARSGNFYYALANGNLANTFTREHPGVTAMWAGTLGFLWRYPEYAREAPGVLTDSTQIEQVLQDNNVEAIDVLYGGRVFMVLTVVGSLVISFWLSTRLIGLWPAVIGYLLIAFDPFFLGLTRILHLDGLMSSLMLLSILAFLNYLQTYLHNGNDRKRWIYILISGVAAGLSWLTKSPALFLVPFIGLVDLVFLVFQWYQRRKISRTDFWELTLASIVWVVIGCSVFILLFPAMWVIPLQILKRIFAEATISASGGHTTTVFFDGRLISGDPAIPNYPQKYKDHYYYPLSYLGHRFYPLVYLWRTTPVILVGVVLLMFYLFIKRKSSGASNLIWNVAVLVIFVGIFTLFMDMGAKKFDRYLLPIFPPLDLLAGLGLAMTVSWVWRKVEYQPFRILIPLCLGGIILWQVIGSYITFPYYLSYYNPLAGGGEKAPDVMMVGWGEGLDQAARLLNNTSGSNELKVLSYYPDGCFSYFFDGETVHAAAEWDETSERLAMVDFVVTYIHQWQRQLPFSEMLDYFQEQTPWAVITINGIEYAQIYDMKEVTPP